MFSILAVAGRWFIGGKSWFSNIVATVGIASAAALGGYTFGYLWGYSAAEKALNAAALSAQVQHLQHELDRRDDADEHAAELASEAAIGDAYNEEVGNDLRATIEAAPSIDGCVTGAFLVRLRKLQ